MRKATRFRVPAAALVLIACFAGHAETGTRGDARVTTFDGVHYGFQGAGEYVLFRGADLRVQVRQAAVSTIAPKETDPYTGLASCGSVTSAIALRVNGDRVTYQPDDPGQPNPAGLELRVNGALTPLPAGSLMLPGGGRLDSTGPQGGLLVATADGSEVIVTPGWWDHVGLWYLHVALRTASEAPGMADAVADGSWLPALPGGTGLGPMPANAADRYNDLYNELGFAWRVTDGTTQFDYRGGTTTSSFADPGWPGGVSPSSCNAPPQPGGAAPPPPQAPLTRAEAEQHCAALVDPDVREHCTRDVMTTGEPGFAETYLREQSVLSPGTLAPLPPRFEN